MADTSLLDLQGGVGSPRFSPDGTRLAFTERAGVFVQRLDGAGPPVAVGEGSAPAWRCDGRALAVVRGGRVWVYPEHGGSGEAVTPADLEVAHFAWAPDGRRIAALPRVDLESEGAVWLVDVATGGVRRVCPVPAYEEAPFGHLSWSPDGRRLAWEAMLYPNDRTNNVFEVRVADIDAGRLQRVVPVGACQTRQPCWRPDGQALAMLATAHAWGFQSLYGLAVWNANGGAARYLCGDPFVARGSVWAPDGQTIYLSARRGGIASQLFAVDVVTGRHRSLTADLADHTGPRVSPDGRWIACEVAAPDRLPGIELVAADGKSEPPPLWGARIDSRPARLGVPEAVRWHSADGLPLEGLLLLPPGRTSADGPFPLIVDIHGGPLGAPPLRLERHPLGLAGLHDLAAQGYAVFSAEYRRSGNFGWGPFERSVRQGDLVGMDATDILCGVDHLVAAGVADPARLGLRGYSHGAFLANWLLTQTGRFRAAVSVDGFCDQTARALPDTILEIWLGGTADDAPLRYRRCSPLTYAAQARTPTLLLHGRRSVFWAQAEAFRQAVTRAGVEVELVAYDEGHWPSDRHSHELILLRTREWFARHLGDPGGAGNPATAGRAKAPALEGDGPVRA